MSETCYVTEVRLMTALEPLAPRAMAAKAAQVASKARFSLASIPWPFLPQAPCTPAPQKETTCVNNNNLRQRRLVSASAVAAATVASAVTPQKLQSKSATVAPSSPSWPTLVLLILEGLRSTVAKSLLGAAVGSALVVLVCEVVTCLASLVLANRVPPGLLFMVAALGLLGFLATQAIGHDSASVRRRKSTMSLFKQQ